VEVIDPAAMFLPKRDG